LIAEEMLPTFLTVLCDVCVAPHSFRSIAFQRNIVADLLHAFSSTRVFFRAISHRFRTATKCQSNVGRLSTSQATVSIAYGIS